MILLKNLTQVDVYIPSPKPGEKIYCYDVNSLYPFVMSKFDMPIGKPKYFKCLRTFDFIGYYKNLFNKKPFGFFRVEVTGYNIEHPILQVKVNTKNGVRTMSPTWINTVIFSEEMYNAEGYGYTFNILEGYLLVLFLINILNLLLNFILIEYILYMILSNKPFTFS